MLLVALRLPKARARARDVTLQFAVVEDRVGVARNRCSRIG
jgi:hypothetical protein